MYDITCKPTVLADTQCDHCEDLHDQLFDLSVAGQCLALCRECLTNVASAVHPYRLSFNR